MTKIVTHNGRFHADDVLAVATLLLVYPEAEIVRSRDIEEIQSADVVVDVGFIYDAITRRFDHHQTGGAGVRDNGIPYASFGLVWKNWGNEVAGDEEAVILEERIVCPVDAYDNGVVLAMNNFPRIRDYTISDLFSSFVDPAETSEEKLLKTFLECVKIAKDLLIREINLAKKEVVGIKKIKEIINNSKDKKIIVLDEDLPWHHVLVTIPETLYVVYPRKEGAWGVKAVPKNLMGFELKKPLPQLWGGKANDELATITGVVDAVFCHNKLFVCSAKSKEGAIKLAEIALKS